MNSETLSGLIEGYLQESLCKTQTEALNTALKESREARDEFRARVGIHGALSEHYADSAASRFEPIFSEPTPQIVRKHWLMPTLAAAAALLALFAVANGFRPQASSSTLAKIVSSSHDVVWTLGGELDQRWQELEEGLVELRIEPGVRMAIEGPAKFRLFDSNRMKIAWGTLSADVSESGHGFTIQTPKGEIVDFGTRFGVRVATDGEAEAHVFEGAIDVVGKDRTRRLTTNEAVKLGTDRNFGTADPRSFPMPSHQLKPHFTEGSFEAGTPISSGMPAEAGHWGGDDCQISAKSKNGKLHPFAGSGMLQFLATRSEGSGGTVAAELWQIVDLRPFAQHVNAGELTAKLSSQFNRVSGSENSNFSLQLTAFRGQISEASAYWERKNDPASERLASASGSFHSDDHPETWEPLSAGMSVPPGTDFLLISIFANENETNRETNEFVGHFADGVTLKLTTKARSADRVAHWIGEGSWKRGENWKTGRPDLERDRILIEGPGEALISQHVAAKQSLWIAEGNNSEGHLRIAKDGQLVKSGFGEIIVGFNPGARATFTVQGKLKTRSRVFIGRNNAESLLDLDGGHWDAGDELIRMAQYGSRGESTIATLRVRNGGQLITGTLELVHDLSTLDLIDGEVDLDLLRIGSSTANEGIAKVKLRGGILRAKRLAFGEGPSAISFDSSSASLWLEGSWSGEQLIAIPGATWKVGGRDALPQDFVIEEVEGMSRIRVKMD